MAAMKTAKAMTLPSVLDLNEAATLRTRFVGLRGGDLAVDASGVERVGGLCAQVFMSAAKTWEEDKKAFTVVKASEAFRKTMQMIGLEIDHLLAKELQQ